MPRFAAASPVVLALALAQEATKAGKDRETLVKEEVESRAAVSDEEVQKYYDENKDRFRNGPAGSVNLVVYIAP